MKQIHLWGGKQNNLKNIEIKIPLGSFTVVCGPSGSGKSSLAFETLYAEGQRRYIESLSNYTRQYLNKAPKPNIDGIENIPPSISIDQKNGVKSSRSTVGTTTEVIDYLRLVFEKIGKAFCPDHNITLEKDSPSSASAKTVKAFAGKRGYILAPIYEKDRTIEGKKLLSYLIKEGFMRIYVPSHKKGAKIGKNKNYQTIPMGKVVELSDPKLQKSGLPKKDFYLVVDRLQFSKEESARVTDSMSQAFHASTNLNLHLNYAEAVALTTDGDQLLLSEAHSCSICNYTFPPITSSLFSFNSPVGACESCKGFGNILLVDESKVIPNSNLSLAQGALKPFTMPSAARDRRALKAYCKKAKIDMHTPWSDLPKAHQKKIWEGTKDFFGVLGLFEYLETKKYKMHVRVFLARHKSPFPCPDCKGTRLRPEALQVLINDRSISDYAQLPLWELYETLKGLKLKKHELEICEEPFKQAISRLHFLNQVGVGYLTLDRPTKTLSGGEYQRLNLSNQLGTALSQTLYVLDEPTVGLHPRDNDRLIQVLKQLNELGNTLVVVEHDHDVINNSTHVIEMGPGSGHLGGEVIYTGTRPDFYKFEKSATVPFLKPSGKLISIYHPRPVDIDKYKYKIELKKCAGNNLKKIDVTIPLNRIVTITGVSGSGKSTLISNTLYPALARKLGLEYKKGLDYGQLKGAENIKNVLFIDQSPIGKTARSNPVTYLKIYDAIRGIMANTKEAKALGYTPGKFSLNVDGGRCPVCKGMGHELIDMIFMDDIEIPCEACDGKKFRPEILEIQFKGKNINQILNMTVLEAMDFFVSYPNIRRPLSLLKDVGLEYIRLGQSARSLSGGESQRLKVAKEFNSTKQKGTLYILDEPTTGLHFREVHLLLKVLNRLVEAGGSVLLVEHNLEIIRNSDYIIDLGPEAGKDGGKIVAVGTPDEVMRSKKSHTGKYLKEYVNGFTKTSNFGKAAPRATL